MATYTYKSCPHCGNQYQNYSTYTKEMTVKEGCPIIYCSSCGKPFLDKDVRELAFYQRKEPEKTRLWQIFLAPLFPFGIGSILLWIASISAEEIGFFWLSLFPFAFYAWIVGLGIKKRNEIDSDSLRAYRESQKRVSNREYVVLLLELGYKIPRSFLEIHYPDLID